MKLSFHGATEEVTGSCFLLTTEHGRLLIDCGMRQGERVCQLHDLDQFTFDPATLTAVAVTHSHFDHTGRLPELVARGFTGPIYSTPPTKAITKIILDDSLNIMTENAERCGDTMPYDEVAKNQALEQMVGVAYHTAIEPFKGVSVMFHDAGHILGSSFISVEVKETGKDPIKLVFSGDIGNDDVPILPDTEVLSSADWVICESTYGDRDHEPPRERSAKLAAFANKILKQEGTLLIPAFSVERTQEILYELANLVEKGKIPQVPVYLDSPLAIRATTIYRHYRHYLQLDHPILAGEELFSFPMLRETLLTDQSKAINLDHRPKIIVAGNGMMTGGRILHHLMRYLPDPNSGLLVVGFQAPGTLGRRILNGDKQVHIYREAIDVKLTIENIEAFSAHGDRDKLSRWLIPETGKIKKIFLVHGEGKTKIAFTDLLKKRTDAEIIIPRLNQEFEF